MSCLVFADLLSIAALCFETSRRNSFELSPTGRELVAIARSLLDFLLSSGAPVSKHQRLDALSSLIRSVHKLHFMDSVGRDILASILTIVLIFRLREGPCADWDSVDISLRDCFKTATIALFPQSSITLVLELLLREELTGDNQILVVSVTDPYYCTCC